jgi:UDP-2,3-diacylglucosamine pyrophosphatase LpxH
MQALAVLALVILTAVVIAALVNFRFLLYPLFPQLNPMRTATRLNLKGNSLFISDLHLRAGQSFGYSAALHELLKHRRVSNLIVVGDLSDSPRDARKILDKATSPSIGDILGLDDLPVKVFFVDGSPPHDPSPKERALFDGTPLVPVGRCVVLSFNGMRVVAYHGQDLSMKGAVGHGWNRFISQLSLERAWKHLAGVPAQDWVIFGHTHIPGINAKHRVANCGGWEPIRFLVHPARSGIYLSPENESIEVVKFG